MVYCSLTWGQQSFQVPLQSWALQSDLTFTKKGSDDKTLENVTFTLTTEDKDGWFMTATSGEDGTVSFTNIPSGHTYTLTEQARGRIHCSRPDYRHSV